MAATEVCNVHPNRAAVEHCEVCARPLCGSCLWYAESGERLCEEHALEWRAEGREIYEPERYAEVIAYSELSAHRPSARRAAYKGNSSDVMGLVALVIGGAVMLSCFGFWYLLPLVAFLFGLIGMLQAHDAIDPGRTRILAGLGLASGGLFLLFFFGILLMCTAGWVLSFAVNSISGSVNFP